MSLAKAEAIALAQIIERLRAEEEAAIASGDETAAEDYSRQRAELQPRLDSAWRKTLQAN
jgi:hypothetical protein